jgi:murein L,D-transpeptidase YafK
MRGHRARLGLLLGLTATGAVLHFLSSAAGVAQGPEVAPAGSKPVRLEVLKSEHTLLVRSGETLLGRYPIGLGPRPVGAKTREGDGATPEGSYSVCVKNPRSRYYLSLGLDYPNADDADRALAEGRIDEEEHRRISRALARGTCPPWDTALGGEIFIHGRGSGSDWTLGCVALADPDMKRLYELVRLGTPVVIKP